MKVAAAVRGGIFGGTLAAAMLAVVGRLLDIGVAPWSWSSTLSGLAGLSVEYGRTALLLVPVGALLGVAAAFCCALVFEFVTHRGGWIAGALVGLLLGVCAAALLAVLPWFAAAFFYTYVPTVSPLGPHDASWLLVAVMAASVVMSAVAGLCYGPPLHATRRLPASRWREIYPTTRRFG